MRTRRHHNNDGRRQIKNGKTRKYAAMLKKKYHITDDLHARAPVDRVAVRVVLFGGEHFEPKKQVQTADSELPLPIRPVPPNLTDVPEFQDLTGRRFGRFIVLGLSAEKTGQWVVRCQCGRYSMRRTKAIKNPTNTQDRCEHCRHLAFLKRRELFQRTGVDADINEF